MPVAASNGCRGRPGYGIACLDRPAQVWRDPLGYRRHLLLRVRLDCLEVEIAGLFVSAENKIGRLPGAAILARHDLADRNLECAEGLADRLRLLPAGLAQRALGQALAHHRIDLISIVRFGAGMTDEDDMAATLEHLDQGFGRLLGIGADETAGAENNSNIKGCKNTLYGCFSA